MKRIFKPILKPLQETDFVSALLEKLNTLDGLRVWRQNSGFIKSQSGHRVRLAPSGAADITGIVKPSGLRLEIEAKVDDREWTEKQQMWKRFIERYGGIYVLVRANSKLPMSENVELSIVSILNDVRAIDHEDPV